VATSNYLSKENKTKDVYAAKRLAIEMKRVLRDLGYDGWVYESNAAVRASTPISLRRAVPFHEEVMLWNNSKVS
jgi:hypothetical protein